MTSTLAPHGLGAGWAASLWWGMLATAAVVFVVVMALLAVALFARRRTGPPGGGHRFVAVGTVVSAVILVGMLFFVLRAMVALSAPASQITIEVTGHQWWWEVRYPDAGFVTANELHVPVGEPVKVVVTSADVIHSFWLPELQGKTDAIPGRTNVTWLWAEVPGRFRGPCAEFCGEQHAHMYLSAVAESPQQFQAWLDAERRPADQPTDAHLRGAQLFAAKGCIACHAVRYGTGAVGGHVGPDLTHVGSRPTLGAGTVDNTPGALAGWIGNPQALKPGNDMPRIDMNGDELQALVDYLSAMR